MLISIANHAKADGTGAWPSIDTIAREAKLSSREVQYAIAQLQKIGELGVKLGGGRGRPNLYHLPLMGARIASFEQLKGAQGSPKGRTEPPERVHTGAGEPSKSEPSTTEPSKDYPPFDIFWSEYPRKLDRDDAKKAWKKITGDEHLGEILASLHAWKLLEQWSDREFVPYPATWLNRGSWKESPKDGAKNDLVERKRELEAQFGPASH